MKKTLKDLFIYNKSNGIEDGFKLPEPPEESEGWTEQGKQGNQSNQSNQSKKEKRQTKIIDPVPVEDLVNSKESAGSKAESKSGNKKDNKKISKSLEDNIKYLKDAFHVPVNQDFVIREFKIAHKIPACICFIDGMIDNRIAIQFTLPQLMDVHAFDHFEGCCPIEYIENNVISIGQIVRMTEYKEIIPQILNGLIVLFVDGCDETIVMESRGYEKRAVSKPATEEVVEGSQEGFTENLRTNITLIRRIVKNENLVTEFKVVSKTNNFMAAVLYMDGIVNPKIVEEVNRRVDSLDVDFISGSSMLEQLLEGGQVNVFPQIISTERPDRVASFLMEGKVILICEGTPFALGMPITFFDLFHSSEDANLRWQFGSFIRIIRLLGILISLFLPGAWTALMLYHQEMLPTTLLASIMSSRAPVPFPFIIELLLMELSFELIREGGIRVPGITGNTLGIIGALILGQSAVEAGLVSPTLIIIVAVSGLGNFAIPNYNLALAVRIYRFALIGFGALAGFFGLSVGFTILCALALNMKSFGVPFFTPIAPTTNTNKDKIIRGPIYDQAQRPDFLQTSNQRRMGSSPRGWINNKPSGGKNDD